MRITEAMSLNNVLLAESQAAERLAQVTQQASSGLRVSQPSDDPAAYASIVQRNAQIATVEARSSAATIAAGDLDLAGSVLNQGTTLLEKVRSLALEATNGTQSSASRAAIGSQVDSLRQQLLAIANTQGASGYLFSGTKSTTAPFDSAGNYQGNAGVTHVEIADGVLAVSNASGSQAFTSAGGRDVFADVQALSTALSANDVPGIQASIANLDGSHAQLVAAQVDAGERADRLHSASTAMTSALTQMQVSRASVRDADMATTISNLQATQTAYQAALQVNKQILSLALSRVTG
jgi:flagellar hook-associated protein 3 FlgL